MPHLTAGLRGEVFPSPFAKPLGKGPSSPLTNFLWGSANLVVGLLLLGLFPVAVGISLEFGVLLLGALLIGLRLSVNFGKARAAGTFTGQGNDKKSGT